MSAKVFLCGRLGMSATEMRSFNPKFSLTCRLIRDVFSLTSSFQSGLGGFSRLASV